MTDKERKSCIRTIEFLRGLAFNVRGVMDIIDARNCDEIIEMLEKQEPQIIHCKDCQWWTNQSTTLQGKCRLHNLNPMPEWYCASGVVKS